VHDDPEVKQAWNFWIPVFTGMTFLTARFIVIPAKAGIQFFVISDIRAAFLMNLT
jgi:hypothetical protein